MLLQCSLHQVSSESAVVFMAVGVSLKGVPICVYFGVRMEAWDVVD